MAMIEFNKNPSRKELVVFAVLLGLFLVVVGLLMRKAFGHVAIVLWCAAPPVAVIGSVVAYTLPHLMRPVYLGWMYAALPIGWTISHLLLGLIYYLVLTPIGLLIRLLGRDPMQRRFDLSAQTYWVPHEPDTEAARYFRQF